MRLFDFFSSTKQPEPLSASSIWTGESGLVLQQVGVIAGGSSHRWPASQNLRESPLG